MQPSSLKVGEDVQIGGKVIKIQQRLGNGAFGVVYSRRLASQLRGTQREYSSKPVKHSIVKRILVFKL